MHRPAVRHKGCSLEQRPHQSHGLVERRREPGARQILEVFDRPLGIDDRFLRPRQQLIDGFCCIRSVPCVSLRLAGRSGPYARVVAVPAGVVNAIAVPSARRCATRRDRHPHPVCMYPTLVSRRVVRCIIGRDTAEHPKQRFPNFSLYRRYESYRLVSWACTASFDRSAAKACWPRGAVTRGAVRWGRRAVTVTTVESDTTT